ncbi:MAG TPA: cysteine--tRNA ligase [Candidatus Paceibacterota bacterium]
MIYFFNTLTRQKEVFKPLKEGHVSMYHCGPTVYDYPTIGNLRSYVFADILRRVFEYEGFAVRQVINITDVGHLVSDADEGEDKIEKAAQREKKTAREIADFYTKVFFDNLKSLHIKTEGTAFPHASEHIDEQITLIKSLESRRFTYKTSDGVYFDTAKVPDYGKLAKLDVAGLKEGARVEKNTEKKNRTDFALWKFSPANGTQRQQEWDSPWGKGFPGWHLECSAMSMLYLGETFDIHTGGIDHIPVHHTNEIAQSEAATGTRFVSYWLHNDFIMINGERMAKSLGNFITLQDIEQKGFDPLVFRYWLLTAHYQTLVNFTWEALEGAQTAFSKLLQEWDTMENEPGQPDKSYLEQFKGFVEDNLATPQAIALMWELVKDHEIDMPTKKATMLIFDKVFGFGFKELQKVVIPEEVFALVAQREEARKKGDWDAADVLRKQINDLGFTVRDTESGPTTFRL